VNYQQAIADATKQIQCRSVAVDAATTTDATTGSGFLSCFPAAATTALDFSTTMVVDADARTTTADAAIGSGFSSCFSAVAATADADAATTTADAANVLIFEGPPYAGPFTL